MKKMKKQDRRHRLALTLLFTGIVLFYMLVTFLLVGGALYLLIRYRILTGPNETAIAPSTIILIFILSGLVFGGLMTGWLSRIPMAPVNRLIDQLNRLAAGDYRARLDYGTFWGRHPTVTELTDSFNRMAQELQSTEMLRSDFINNFSHEFKTPIVSIAGFTKLLRRGNLSEEEKAEYLRIIEEESMRLSRMATNVLNLTRVENQTILTDKTQFNLSEQIRACILLLSEKWEEKEIEFSPDFKEHTICADAELLKQVWINLLDNAVKFTPRGGLVEVKITQQAQQLCVSVRNTGSEIAAEHREKIFHKFYQADESHASEGNGIGLAIVKRVTQLHGGSVTVDSGNGSTTFTVRLPKTQD